MLALLLALQLLTGGTARAAGDPAFERGLTALQQGRADEAVTAFEESLRAEPRAQTWLNLGIAHVRLGQPHEAVRAFNQYLQLADPARENANISAVRSEVARLRATSTVLVLAVTPAPSSVQVDGREQEPVGGEVLLQPGPHTLALWSTGYRRHRQAINLPAGRFQFALSLLPGADEDAQVPPPPIRQQPPVASGQPEVLVADNTAEDGNTVPAGPEEGEPPCVLGDACIGAVLTLGAPNALGGALQLRINDHLGLSAGATFLPKITISGVDVHTQLLSAAVQVHPLGNGLFASLGFGMQNIVAQAERPAGRVRADLNIPVLGLGFGYVGRSGFVLGIDFSFLIELSDPPLTVVVPGEELDPALQALLEQEANDAVKEIRDMLPFMFQFNVLRVGFLF